MGFLSFAGLFIIGAFAFMVGVIEVVLLGGVLAFDAYSYQKMRESEKDFKEYLDMMRNRDSLHAAVGVAPLGSSAVESTRANTHSRASAGSPSSPETFLSNSAYEAMTATAGSSGALMADATTVTIGQPSALTAAGLQGDMTDAQNTALTVESLESRLWSLRSELRADHEERLNEVISASRNDTTRAVDSLRADLEEIRMEIRRLHGAPAAPLAPGMTGAQDSATQADFVDATSTDDSAGQSASQTGTYEYPSETPAVQSASVQSTTTLEDFTIHKNDETEEANETMTDEPTAQAVDVQTRESDSSRVTVNVTGPQNLETLELQVQALKRQLDNLPQGTGGDSQYAIDLVLELTTKVNQLKRQLTRLNKRVNRKSNVMVQADAKLSRRIRKAERASRKRYNELDSTKASKTLILRRLSALTRALASTPTTRVKARKATTTVRTSASTASKAAGKTKTKSKRSAGKKSSAKRSKVKRARVKRSAKSNRAPRAPKAPKMMTIEATVPTDSTIQMKAGDQ